MPFGGYAPRLRTPLYPNGAIGYNCQKSPWVCPARLKDSPHSWATGLQFNAMRYASSPPIPASHHRKQLSTAYSRVHRAAREPIRNTMQDTMTSAGAAQLARQIRAYWAAKGKTVITYVEAVKIPGGGGTLKGELFCVRSNMVNGQPQ